MALENLQDLTALVEQEGERLAKNNSIVQDVAIKEEIISDDGDEFKIIPTPNFTDAKSVGTVLPINMVSETVNNLSKLANQFDLVEYVRAKLGYATKLAVIQSFSSEQVSAIVLAIQQFEIDNAFILGDAAGIGKGRVCAAILRYAYQRKLIPIFFTHKPYLFSDIYRDVTAIGGFGMNGNKTIMPAPFIFNSGNADESSVRDKYGKIVAAPLTNKATLDICETLKFPKKEYNCVFLTYSQLSNVRSDIKQNFLEEIAPNSIMVFDESHNAASSKSTAKVLLRATPLVQKSKGVLFASATYAKNPDVFPLYVIRTALRTAVPSMESISRALKVGGENVSEYIASGLAKEGQMIRRERSFGDCEKITAYVEDPNQRAFYDEAISYFKELRDFSKTELATRGILNAIIRKCGQMRKQLANMQEYSECFRGSKGEREQAKEAFIENNRNKYIYKYTSDSISRYKMFFRENLFYAIKSKFTADEVIKCLNTPVEYTNVDGKTYSAPKKPLIAIRNTNESIFSMLDLKDGDKINNDFADYLRAIYRKLFVGTFRLRKVNNDVFESKVDLIERGKDIDNIEETHEYQVEMDDFPDGGAFIQSLQSRLDAYRSELPLSVIDYIRDRIQTTSRSSVYFNENGQPKYGNGSTNYTFNEATGRDFMLKREGDSFIFTKNDKLKSTTEAFRAYNSGVTDVLLINVSASTGGSAQSSPEEGSDTRPRDMFIVQFELDINVEVQKRGRVNRTGQLNSPTYTYIISKIPVEQRTYLMFRRKLRKLDANTSANQTQSAQSSEITDMNGNPIQDIFNQYGFDTFKNRFIDEPEYFEYARIFDDMVMEKDPRSKGGNFEGEAEEQEYNINQFNDYVRELELYPSDFQEVFFDVMNEKYLEYITTLKSTGDYQLELEAKNYKAAIKQRVVVRLNSGTTVFSQPLFLEDDYTLEDKRAWSMDKVNAKASELANGKDPKDFYRDFLRDYSKEFEDYRQLTLRLIDSELPLRGDYESQESYEEAVEKANRRRSMTLNSLALTKSSMLDMITYFTPMKKVSYEGNLGLFVGFNFKKTGAKFKYSAGGIEFIFCFLNRFPILHLSLAGDIEILKSIQVQTNVAFGEGAPRDLFRAIDAWRPDVNKRTIRRFLSGNILSAVVEANAMKAKQEIKNFNLVRYTNIDNSKSTGVELKFEYGLNNKSFINEATTQLSVSCVNDMMRDFINSMPYSERGSYATYSPIWDDEMRICLIKTSTGLGDVLSVFVIGYVYKGKLVKETSSNFNPIFIDTALERRFRDNLTKSDGIVTANYFPKIKRKKKIKGQEAEVGDDTGTKQVFESRYTFYLENPESVATMREFFTQLDETYLLSFNFRSSSDEYYAISEQPDEFNPNDVQASRETEFAEGDYEYRFSKTTPESVAENIPHFVRMVAGGFNGGVITDKPLSPTILPSYNLKPFNIPYDILMKLFLSQLNSREKTEFRTRITDLSETSSLLEIGQYAEKFIRERLVPINYFFGDLRTSQYGEIFKRYITSDEFEVLAFEEEVSVKERRPAEAQVNFEGAENFLIRML